MQNVISNGLFNLIEGKHSSEMNGKVEKDIFLFSFLNASF